MKDRIAIEMGKALGIIGVLIAVLKEDVSLFIISILTIALSSFWEGYLEKKKKHLQLFEGEP